MLTFIIGLVLMGLVLGLLARLLVPGPDSMSLGWTMALGIVGSLIAGLIGRTLFDSDGTSFLLALVVTIGLVLLTRRTGTGRRHMGTV